MISCGAQKYSFFILIVWGDWVVLNCGAYKNLKTWGYSPGDHFVSMETFQKGGLVGESVFSGSSLRARIENGGKQTNRQTNKQLH